MRQLRSIQSLCQLVTSGGTPRREDPANYSPGIYPWIKTAELSDTDIFTFKERISQKGLATSSAKILPIGTVLMAMYGATVGKLGRLTFESTCNQASCAMVADPRVCDSRWLFYALLHRRRDLIGLANGAAQQNLSAQSIKAFKLRTPVLDEQAAIAEVLGALDDKIAANEALKSTHLRLGTAMTRQAAQDGRSASVGEIADFHNRRRVPLSANQRSARRGHIPYWGANGQMDYVDEALFDEPIVLVGEDGSVLTDSGKAVVHHVWGPSWVNNHAHVLTGRRTSTELLFLLMRDLEVSSAVTGAVQPKLSMGNLKAIHLNVPFGSALIELETKVQPLVRHYRALTNESRTLAQLRDTLLPALMDGRIRVRDAIERTEEVL